MCDQYDCKTKIRSCSKKSETASLQLKQVPVQVLRTLRSKLFRTTYCKQFDSATIDDKAVCGNLSTDENELRGH